MNLSVYVINDGIVRLDVSEYKTSRTELFNVPRTVEYEPSFTPMIKGRFSS